MKNKKKLIKFGMWIGMFGLILSVSNLVRHNSESIYMFYIHSILANFIILVISLLLIITTTILLYRYYLILHDN